MRFKVRISSSLTAYRGKKLSHSPLRAVHTLCGVTNIREILGSATVADLADEQWQILMGFDSKLLRWFEAKESEAIYKEVSNDCSDATSQAAVQTAIVSLWAA